jgi:branched-chain amino acid transport system substrate-binding protein
MTPDATRRRLLSASLAGAAALALPRPGAAQSAAPSKPPLRIGVLNDQSGPYADLAGPGSAQAVRLAVADGVAAGLDRQVEVLVADHQNKPDVGLALIRDWMSNGRVDVVMDICNSAISLGAQSVAAQYDKPILHVSSTTSELAGKGCGRNGIQWAQNTYADAHGLARSMLNEGKRSYFFITVDYAFGQAVEADMRGAIQGSGTVLGAAKHPLNNSDFASLLTTAQVSGAEVVVLANSGADLITSVKQAGEFGLAKKQTLVAPIVYLTDVHALGLEAAQGLQFVQSWYWDQDEASRAWAKRFFAERRRMPTDLQAGAYSAALHYLRAVQAAGTAETGAVLGSMRDRPVNDMYAQGGRILANNKMTFDLLLARVKSPGASRYPWDYLDVVARIPGDQAFRPLKDTGCALVKA